MDTLAQSAVKGLRTAVYLGNGYLEKTNNKDDSNIMSWFVVGLTLLMD